MRRAALGALRIIVEKNLPLDLEDLVKKSVQSYESVAQTKFEENLGKGNPRPIFAIQKMGKVSYL